MSMKKNPSTPSGIESATFRLLAQFLNQLRHRVPPTFAGIAWNSWYCRNVRAESLIMIHIGSNSGTFLFGGSSDISQCPSHIRLWWGTGETRECEGDDGRREDRQPQFSLIDTVGGPLNRLLWRGPQNLVGRPCLNRLILTKLYRLSHLTLHATVPQIRPPQLSILRTDKLIPATTTNFISSVNTCCMFRPYWLSSGIICGI